MGHENGLRPSSDLGSPQATSMNTVVARFAGSHSWRPGLCLDISSLGIQQYRLSEHVPEINDLCKGQEGAVDREQLEKEGAQAEGHLRHRRRRCSARTWRIGADP